MTLPPLPPQHLPHEFARLGITPDDWAYELMVEAVEQTSDAFGLLSLGDTLGVDWLLYEFPTLERVLRDMVKAGLLREFDMRSGPQYCRIGIEPSIAEPLMYIYRLYDAEDALLYIGCSQNVNARLDSHASDKAWWREVDDIDTTPIRGYRRAFAAETVAIRTEQPRYNKAHNPRNSVRRLRSVGAGE